MSTSIRYDISWVSRLLRSLPVLAFYGALLTGIVVLLPRSAWDLPLKSFLAIGLLSAWRYLWLLTHIVRANIYEKVVYPKLRFRADSLPETMRFPDHLYLVVPTFREKELVTRRMLNSIISEAGSIRSQVTVFVNAGSDAEDQVFRDTQAAHPQGDQIEMIFIRQIGGKRQGMADVLRELEKRHIGEDDAIVLMDGDTVLGDGVFRKCLPLFLINPKLGAVTTDNISITTGKKWYRDWYTLRFAMRHRLMKSQALSGQVLVLTGRFSVFRARLALSGEFIFHLEEDGIDHWLHGRVKFITGDDKSTWFCLLKQGMQMLYVPDAVVYCMEDSGEKPLQQSIKKMHRWFGNMLRNNWRAINLGVGPQGLFTWWSSVDQRISIWTTMLGPMCALWLSLWVSPYYLVLYPVSAVTVRLIYLLVLTAEGHRMRLLDVPLLMYTQWAGSMVKIYVLFHLNEQGWDSGRKAEDAKDEPVEVPWLNHIIPKLQIAFAVLLMFAGVAWFVGVG